MVAMTSRELAPIDRLSSAVSDLEPDSAKTLRAAFETMFSQAEEWEQRAKLIKITSVDQKHDMKVARESRLALRAIRIDAEKARKRLKEDSVRRGRAIDGIANVLKALIEPIEEYLLEQEEFADRVEAKRKDALRSSREDALRAYGVDPSVYANLGETSDETWELTLDAARSAHAARAEAARRAEEVRVEAERIAAEKREADRQAAIKAEAERVERERLAKEENDRLRAEAAEREAAAKVEREKAAAEKAEIEAKAKADREAAEAETAKARAAEKKAADDLAAAKAAEAAAARKREAETAARVAAEKEAAEKAEAERLAAESAPDREKLFALAATLRALPLPAMTSEKGKAVGAKVSEQMGKMVAWLERTASQL